MHLVEGDPGRGIRAPAAERRADADAVLVDVGGVVAPAVAGVGRVERWCRDSSGPVTEEDLGPVEFEADPHEGQVSTAG